MNTDYLQVTEIAGDKISKEQLLRLKTRYFFASKYSMGKDVLEVACGTGPGLGVLEKVSNTIVAGDYSHSLVSIASTYYKDRVPLLRFDAHYLPFKDNSFDVVICYEAIYYFKEPEIFVQECLRLLRQGGYIIFCNPNKDLPDFNPSPYSYFYFSPIDFRNMLSKYGFYIECFGDCPVDYSTMRQKILSFIKRIMVRFDLMPKTMSGKKLFKRIVFGKLVPMPNELNLDSFSLMPKKISCDLTDKEHKVIFVVGQLRDKQGN